MLIIKMNVDAFCFWYSSVPFNKQNKGRHKGSKCVKTLNRNFLVKVLVNLVVVVVFYNNHYH